MDKGHKPLAHALIMISGKKVIMRKLGLLPAQEQSFTEKRGGFSH